VSCRRHLLTGRQHLLCKHPVTRFDARYHRRLAKQSLNWLLANHLKDLSGGSLLYGCHYHYWDPSCANAVFVERVTGVSIGCVLPKSIVLFAARFMSDVCLDLTANRAHGARIGFQVEVPGWILSLSPVGCDEGKRIWVALIADAKQGRVRGNPLLAPVVVKSTTGNPARELVRVARPLLNLKATRSK